jgi:hypothetical protein
LAKSISAVSAFHPAAGVERAAFRASDIHGAGKKICDYGAHSQDGGHQQNLLKSRAHGDEVGAIQPYQFVEKFFGLMSC